VSVEMLFLKLFSPQETKILSVTVVLVFKCALRLPCRR
jgi:hypothetical protein